MSSDDLIGSGVFALGNFTHHKVFEGEIPLGYK